MSINLRSIKVMISNFLGAIAIFFTPQWSASSCRCHEYAQGAEYNTHHPAAELISTPSSAHFGIAERCKFGLAAISGPQSIYVKPSFFIGRPETHVQRRLAFYGLYDPKFLFHDFYPFPTSGYRRSRRSFHLILSLVIQLHFPALARIEKGCGCQYPRRASRNGQGEDKRGRCPTRHSATQRVEIRSVSILWSAADDLVGLETVGNFTCWGPSDYTLLLTEPIQYPVADAGRCYIQYADVHSFNLEAWSANSLFRDL